MSKTCEQCGNEIKGKGKRFCSAACDKIRRRTLIGAIRNCIMCGKDFEPSYKDQQCCGDECAKKKTVARLRELAPKHIYTCQNCGKEYKAKKPDRNKYCGRECSKTAAVKTRGIAPVFVSVCIICGCHSDKQACSDECQRVLIKEQTRLYGIATKVLKPRPCKECGKSFTPEYGNKRRNFCSDICLKRNVGRKGKATRRARIAGCTTVEVIDPLAVLKRDKWKCHICGRATPKHLRGTTENNAPEMDHIIPLAKGGSHTWDNVACACRECNGKKGDQLIGQQMLPVFASI